MKPTPNVNQMVCDPERADRHVGHSHRSGPQSAGRREIWFDEEVALRLDALLTKMPAPETVAIRPFPEVEPTAA